ncbi:MAG: desulfoferrodoxin [Desulfovibrio sp.]|jgi:superoxide reductase|nr:desulfoferrodoxin [Desulfovibrio sp.]
MANQYEVFKCGVCGNIVETLHAGAGEMACCGSPMKLLKEGSSDGAKEKHVPVVGKTPGGYKVKVGEIAHPMEEKHYIEWIELVADGISYTRYLKPGQTPEAEFSITGATAVSAREYCNLHGQWKAPA